MEKNGTKKTAGAAAPNTKDAQADKGTQAEGATTGATGTAAGAVPPAAASAAGPADAVQQVGGVSDKQIEELADSLLQDRGPLSSLAWPPQLFDVRVLAPVTIGSVRYQPNTVLEGLPLALLEAHLGSVDPHPEAVDYARANDGEVVQYQAPNQEEDEGQG